MFQSIHHIGIATKDIDSAISEYTTKLGFTFVERERLEHLGVEVAFLKLERDDTLIELLGSLNTTSSVAKYLSKHPEGGIHHICYQVEDIKESLKELTKKGYELIDKEPRKGAHNALIAFIHPKAFSGVLVELCQIPA